MKLRHNFVLIKVEQAENQTKSGIFIAEKSKSYPPTGEVKAVGPDVKDIKVGQRVVFMRYASIDALEDDERFCKPEHIIAIL